MKNVKFEEKHVNYEFNETTLYFKAPRDLVSDQFPEADSCTIALVFAGEPVSLENFEAALLQPCVNNSDFDLMYVDFTDQHIQELIQIYEEASKHVSVTKEELKNRLEDGELMSNIFTWYFGQCCIIVKGVFSPDKSDEIIYIPDPMLNNIPMNEPADDEDIDFILNCCYTTRDFIDITNGDVAKAEKLFNYVDWQHPSSALDAGELDEEPNTYQPVAAVSSQNNNGDGSHLTVERLKSLFRAYVHYDSEAADPDYISEVLHGYCGCTDKELRELGLDEFCKN